MAARHERAASREMYLKQREMLAKSFIPEWTACYLKMKRKFRADWLAAYREDRI